MRFEMLYQQSFSQVFKATLLLCGDRHIAEECTQEAFARALERWDRIAGKKWAVGWVMTTALNQARRTQRRYKIPDESWVSSFPQVEASVDLWKAISNLPRRQQDAIALHYIADLPIDQVGSAMGCKAGTVKAHLWRARRQLSAHLGDDDVEG